MFKIIELLVNSTQAEELKKSMLQKYMERLTSAEHSAEYAAIGLSSLISLNSFLFRDFAIIINQLRVWTLTSDVDYLRTSSLEGFSSLIKKYKTEFQVSADISIQNSSFSLSLFLQAICNSSYITDLFTNEIYTRKSVVSQSKPAMVCAERHCVSGLPTGGHSAAVPRPPRHQPAQTEVLPRCQCRPGGFPQDGRRGPRRQLWSRPAAGDIPGDQT